MTGLLDTNIAIYLLGGRLAHPLPSGAYAISVITEMELLSRPGLSSEEEASIREFVGAMTLVELTAPVRGIAINMRQSHRLKLPDAIVAASAVSMGTELFTNDEKLAKTPGVRTRSLEIK